MIEAGRSGLELIERSIYRGPNLFSMQRMIRLQVDLGELEQWPTDRLPDFNERLLERLPGLERHGCSYGEPGGLVRRLHQGTWLGHVIEHVALEIQNLCGHVRTRGKTRSVRGRPGVYNILYAYVDEAVGTAAGAAAIRLVVSMLPAGLNSSRGVDLLGPAISDNPQDVPQIVQVIQKLAQNAALGPTTQSLVDAARKRGIPAMRLNDQSLVQLGQGARQQRIRASVTGKTSLIGAEFASNKNAAKTLLADAGLPVPKGVVVHSADDAAQSARRIGFPVVVKPLSANHGRGVTTGVSSETEARAAFNLALRHGRRVIVERHLPGTDHRILVIGGKMVAVAERVPAQVIGDGVSNIGHLIERVNADPRRGPGHAHMLTRIAIDASTLALLARDGRSLSTIPLHNQKIMLRDTANLSSGGTAIDRTDEIHPDNITIAEQAALVIGLDVAGIDLLTPDISRPVRETGGGIVEVNAAPGLRMHLAPSEGCPRDVAAPIIEHLFPRGSRSRIPIFAITGTNGKSTTARMVARILGEAGFKVGLTTTSGVYVNGYLLSSGDSSGPKSARMILRNPLVDAAVLETARGGILREGLGFDRCDVGAVLNVTADHLGVKGIETIEDLARVKSVVTESVSRRGHSVLNADDPMTVSIARHARGKIIWFSNRSLSPKLKRHLDSGGRAVICEPGSDGGTIVLYNGVQRREILAATGIPATFGGSAEFNIQNAMAAAAMCIAQRIPMDAIRAGLGAFTTSFADSPGRMNVHDDHGFRVIVDYAHNPAALTALGNLIEKMRPADGKVYGMVSIPGDRRDEDLIEMGRLAAGIFDEIMFREAPDGRGRSAGSINALMAQGAIAGGLRSDCIHRLVNEEAATAACLQAANEGDLIALMPTDVDGIWNQVVNFRPEIEQTLSNRVVRYG